MRIRYLALLASLLLILAACGGSGSDQPSATADGSSSTTSTAAPAPDEVLLSYSLSAGDTFVYDVDVTQSIEMTSEGEGSGFSGGEEDLPASANVDLEASGKFTFEVADGPEPGTYSVTITSDLTTVEATGSVDGEPLDTTDVPDFADIEPVSTTVVVDAQGNVVPSQPDLEDPFGGMLGGMSDFGPGAMPGAQLGQFFGPPFLDEEVTVGDSWTNSFDNPGFGTDPISTSVTSTVTGTDDVDGHEVFVLESNTVVDAFEFDLGEFFIGLFSGFLPDDASAEEQAQIDELMQNLRFVMSFDESSSNSTTYFDPEAGLTRMFDVTGETSVGMDVNFPDEESGEMMGFVMDMTIEQTVTHKLVSGPTA